MVGGCRGIGVRDGNGSRWRQRCYGVVSGSEGVSVRDDIGAGDGSRQK